jgi:hypothetical protein
MVEAVGVEPAEQIKIPSNFRVKIKVCTTSLQLKFSLLYNKYVGERGNTGLYRDP